MKLSIINNKKNKKLFGIRNQYLIPIEMSIQAALFPTQEDNM
jgi:hypothetical protein